MSPFVSSEESYQHTALSYCWRGVQPFKAMKATLHLLEAGFHSEQLAESIQDAIVISTKMNMFYFCELCGLMGHVYFGTILPRWVLR